MRKLIFKISKPVKVNNFLKDYGFSSAVITELKKYSFSMVCGGKEVRTNDVLKENSVFTVTFFEKEPVFSGNLPLLYEDEDFFAVLKPADMPTHPSKGHRFGGTLFDEFNGTFRSLYRLDKDTEGIVLIAKNCFAASVKNSVKKIYFGVLKGEINETGTVNLPISETDKQKRIISKDGKRAVTHYKRLIYKNGYSLVAFYLETGRTHQIRLHTASIGFPLLGDFLYGEASLDFPHQLLFMGYCDFVSPVTKKRVILKAPFPEIYKKLFELDDCNAVFTLAVGSQAEGADAGV